MADALEKLVARKEEQERLFPRQLLRVYEDTETPTNQWVRLPPTLPQICLDVRAAMNGSADPWPEQELRATHALLTQTVLTWTPSRDRIDEAVLAMVRATIGWLESEFKRLEQGDG